MTDFRNGSIPNPLVLQGLKTITLFGGLFLALLTLSYCFFGVITDLSTVRAFGIDSLPWFLLGFAIPAISYLLADDFLTPFLWVKILALWCLVCISTPLAYSIFVDMNYAEIAKKDFGGWHDLTAFLSFCLYWAIRWDLFSDHDNDHRVKSR
ncbi:MAG: hypothetical protein CMF13_02220 [Idiomarina sp.]|nr:hypothetical protein [Idiomarina sp.]|tara:strand:+ start:1368 stop:1823 length:456 start_codon:yes stop_codon:yes gene_type:complete